MSAVGSTSYILKNKEINSQPCGIKRVRLTLFAVNVVAAVAPILGYLSAPQKTSFGEVSFDVATHVLRATTFLFRKPPQVLVKTAKYVESYRLFLIATNAVHGTSTFPVVIQAGDTAIHCASLYGAYKFGLL